MSWPPHPIPPGDLAALPSRRYLGEHDHDCSAVGGYHGRAILGASPMPEPIEAGIAAVARRLFGNVQYRFDLPVSSPYGWRFNKATGDERHHDGIDLPVANGTPVLAIYAADVDRIDIAGEGKGEVNGNAIILKSGAWKFCYLHLSRVYVRVGERVGWGQVIGASGNTGRVYPPPPRGNHLHFQVYFGSFLVNPRVLYPGGLLGG